MIVLCRGRRVSIDHAKCQERTGCGNHCDRRQGESQRHNLKFHFLDNKQWLGKPRAAFEKTPRSRLRAATRELFRSGVAQIPSVTPTQAATQTAARASRPLPKSNSPRRQNAAGVGRGSTARRCRISRHTPERKLSKSGLSPLAAANLERSRSKESVGFIAVFNVSVALKPSFFSPRKDHLFSISKKFRMPNQQSSYLRALGWSIRLRSVS